MTHSQLSPTETECQLLFAMAAACRPRCIVEVGTGAGGSLSSFCRARVWLKEHMNINCQVWSCDTRDVSGFVAERFPSANFIHGDVDDLLKVLPKPPDFVFIDGDHSYEGVKKDLDTLWPVASDGAVFVLHDTEIPQYHPGVRRLALDRGALFLPAEKGLGVLRKWPDTLA